MKNEVIEALQSMSLVNGCLFPVDVLTEDATLTERCIIVCETEENIVLAFHPSENKVATMMKRWASERLNAANIPYDPETQIIKTEGISRATIEKTDSDGCEDRDHDRDSDCSDGN